MVNLSVAQDSAALFYIAMQYVPGFGARRQARLFQHFNDMQGVITATDAAFKEQGLSADVLYALRQLWRNPDKSPYLERAKCDYEICQQNNWQLLSQESPQYPTLLKQIDTPPSLLYINGNIDLLSQEQVAMVGSRHASASGLHTADKLAAEFASAGLVVTSGMALGIDSACHAAAIKTGKPTIAVMGTGMAKVYPHRNRQLALKIAETGTIVSEFPINTPPIASNFPQRNRIVSGLCRATVVVEAASRSGSLITARFALEQNRDVFAIPGSLHNPQSEGCNELIKQGASLLSTINDVLINLPANIKPVNNIGQGLDQTRGKSAAEISADDTALSEMTQEEQQATIKLAGVLLQIGFEPTSIEVIEKRTDKSALELTPLLVELQLSGRVQQQGAEYVRVR